MRCARFWSCHGLPFAPVNRPEDLFDDPHLLASGGLGKVRTENGGETLVPLLPLLLGERRLGEHASAIPAIGNGTKEILAELGYSTEEIALLLQTKAAAAPSESKELA